MEVGINKSEKGRGPRKRGRPPNPTKAANRVRSIIFNENAHHVIQEVRRILGPSSDLNDICSKAVIDYYCSGPNKVLDPVRVLTQALSKETEIRNKAEANIQHIRAQIQEQKRNK